MKIGDKFGRLTVVEIERVGPTPRNKKYWRCRCDCGQEITVESWNLKTGNTKSCGCLKVYKATKHGLARTKVYRTWQGMRQRCENPKATQYEDYGGRGIKVCDRWQKFENFLEDMGIPKEGQSIERIENSGNYGPDNCHWTDRVTQMANRRKRRDYQPAIFYSPSGSVITVDPGRIGKACIEFNLSPSKISAVLSGKRPHHRLWTAKYVTTD